jgi:hypothetical protein
MKRYAAWALGAGLVVAASAAPASAQVHVDVGVIAPHVGARVVVGGPRVVYVPAPRYYEPRVVRHPGRGRALGHYKRGWDRYDRRDREYYRDVAEARREYERDIRDARRDYERDIREAARDRRW